MAEENSEPFGFDPASVDYLLLTHAHLDHCGRILLLAKRGFKGEVITTAASAELALRICIGDGADGVVKRCIVPVFQVPALVVNLERTPPGLAHQSGWHPRHRQ